MFVEVEFRVEKTRAGGNCLNMAAAIAATLATLVPALSALRAQDAPQGVDIAQTPNQRAFNIPPQALSTALVLFGQQAGRQITADAEAIQGLSTPGVQGTLAIEEALRRLLAGTGLTFSAPSGATIVLQKPGQTGASGALQLDPISVEGQPQTSTDGMIGFVATRSAAGTKTNTPILEIPQSVSVVTREQMERRQTQTVDEALRYSPGVSVSGKEDNRFDYASARGFPLVQYLDGLRLGTGSFAASQTEPYFLQRIDVLQGPASSLYGRSSPGGLMDMVSKRPDGTRFSEVQLQTGSYDRLQGAIDTAGKLDGEGKLTYRLTALARDADTQVDYIRNQRLTIAPSLTWRPDSNTSLTVLVNYQDDPAGGLYGRLPALGSIAPASFGYIRTSLFTGDLNINVYRRDQYSIGYQFEHRFDDVWTFRQNTRYRHIDLTYNFLYATGYANATTLRRNLILDTERLDTFAVDNTLLAKFETSGIGHELLLGLDYYQSNWSYRYAVGAGPTLNVLSPNYFQQIVLPALSQNLSQTQNQTGLYAQDQIKLDRLMVTLGGRYDWSIQKQNNWLTRSVSGQYDGAFTGRAGVNYVFDNGIAPYASYAESFEPVIGVDFGGTPFRPTTGQQFEVGVKYKPTFFNGLFTVAYFDLKQQNVLTADPNPAHGNSQVQTGEITSQGVQLSATASLTDGLNFVASYSYLDNKVTKSNSGLVGKMPAGVSPELASAWVDYTFQKGPLVGLTLGGGVRYTSWSYGDPGNTFMVPGYTIADLTLQYDLGEAFPEASGARLALNVNNLFDTTYVAGCSTTTTCYYGFRRNVLATLTYKW